MSADRVLWLVGVFLLCVFVGARLWVWWVTKVRPASDRIDADVELLRGMTSQSPLFDDEGLLR